MIGQHACDPRTFLWRWTGERPVASVVRLRQGGNISDLSHPSNAARAGSGNEMWEVLGRAPIGRLRLRGDPMQLNTNSDGAGPGQ